MLYCATLCIALHCDNIPSDDQVRELLDQIAPTAESDRVVKGYMYVSLFMYKQYIDVGIYTYIYIYIYIHTYIVRGIAIISTTYMS